MNVGVAACAAAVIALAACGSSGESRQEKVAKRGARVMPFDLERTTHVFRPTATGGIQTVISDDRDVTQVRLIRRHLRKEAASFARGVFADPRDIHGSHMPGLATLEARAAALDVRYKEVALGARIRFTAEDRELVDAIHRWFEAQAADHGDHAHIAPPTAARP